MIPEPSAKLGKTLVLQPLPGIGDMVWHLPHIDAIATATRSGSITLMTKSRALADQIFAGDRRVDDILILDRSKAGGRHDGVLGARRLAEDLRPHGFEYVWILHNSTRYALAAAMAGIPERIGFGIGWQNMALTTQFPLTRRDMALHPSEKATKLLEQHGLPVDPIPRYRPPAAAQRSIEDAFGARARPWLGLGIGSSETFKQWGTDRFTALADTIAVETGGTVFLLGGPGERDMAEEIAQKTGAVPVVGFPLSEVAALAKACDILVSNDTGLMNLAAASGAATIGLFGGSPAIDNFYPSLSAIIPPGGPVYRKDRMAEIGVGFVSDEVRRRLSASQD